MTHPIETESYRRLEARIDLSHFTPKARGVVARVIHATADFDFAASLRVSDSAVDAGCDALARQAPVVVDVEMVRVGISGLAPECFLTQARQAGAGPEGRTLSARAMHLAGLRHPEGAVFVVGCAPTALEQLIDMVETGLVRPALVVGVPVGFVGAAEAKERLGRCEAVASIWNVGERGGSPVAAAIVNALVRLHAAAAGAGRDDGADPSL